MKDTLKLHLLTYEAWGAISRITELGWGKWRELVTDGKWINDEMMLGERRRMAGALEGAAINPNGEVAISNGAVTNEGEKGKSANRIRIQEINTKR